MADSFMLLYRQAAGRGDPRIARFERSFVTAGGLASLERMKRTNIAARRTMSIVSSEVRNRRTCQCKLRQNTNWL